MHTPRAGPAGGSYDHTSGNAGRGPVGAAPYTSSLLNRTSGVCSARNRPSDKSGKLLDISKEEHLGRAEGAACGPWGAS